MLQAFYHSSEKYSLLLFPYCGYNVLPESSLQNCLSISHLLLTFVTFENQSVILIISYLLTANLTVHTATDCLSQERVSLTVSQLQCIFQGQLSSISTFPNSLTFDLHLICLCLCLIIYPFLAVTPTHPFSMFLNHSFQFLAVSPLYPS